MKHCAAPAVESAEEPSSGRVSAAPSATGPLRHLRDELAALEAAGLLRVPPPARPDALSFCSNDYLGLADRPIAAGSSGAAASRLVSGNRAEHEALETELSAWLETEASIVFSSGYAANVGVIAALARPGDLIVSDFLNHASLIDGARLSRARVHVVPHIDPDAVAEVLRHAPEARRWVITESYFSMDGDGPDLRALREICDAHDAGLVVDEAHALGVLGPEGRGRCAEAGIAPDVLLGTFGKAFGTSGAFAAGSAELRLWLWNRARSFVFSTGLSPAIARSAHEAVVLALREPSRRDHAARCARELRDGLRTLGLDVRGFGHVVPAVVGDPRRAVRLAELLLERGIFVQPIRPPSVPVGTARLRFTATARHTGADVARVIAALRDALACSDG